MYSQLIFLGLIAILAAGCGKSAPQPAAAPEPTQSGAAPSGLSATAVKEGDRVKVHYVGALQDGTVFDQSPQDTPLEFKVGSGQVIPGFDQAVRGMALNEEKRVTIPMQQAYGPHLAEMMKAFDRTMFPPQYKIAVGAIVRLRSPQGQPVPGRITEITDTAVIIDLNHPLAGQDLTFTLRVASINS